MPDVVAIAGLASTTIVAIGVPIVNGVVSGRQSAAQRREDRIDELRDVLDAAVVSVSAAQRAWSTGARLLRKRSKGEHVDEQAIVAAIERLDRCRAEVWRLEDRLGVRLGWDDQLWQRFVDIGMCVSKGHQLMSGALAARSDLSEDRTYDRLLEAKRDVLRDAGKLVGPFRR